MGGRIWIDVEDLFVYAHLSRRPSGIQRVVYEVARAMVEDLAADIRFVRHGGPRGSYSAVPWSAVQALFKGLTEPSPGVSGLPKRRTVERLLPPDSSYGRALRRVVYRLPDELRVKLVKAFAAQVEAVSWGWAMLRALPGVTLRALRGSRGVAAVPVPEAEDFAALVAPGDTIVVLGAPWVHPAYAELLDIARARYGIRFALLVHDLIPVRRPEWADRRLAQDFGIWYRSMVPRCDMLFTYSRATARDLVGWAAKEGLALRGEIWPVPVGSRFGVAAEGPSGRGRKLPEPGSYVLYVSTIEVRKNHAILVRVWRALIDQWGAGRVPTLVFAGGVGWLVQDLMRQLVNTDWLGGRVIVFEAPDDAELAALYRGCMFTVFPSLYEGWGLPVTESMAFGKPCVAANTTSLPEAGGDLARYFDPENLRDALAVISDVLADPAALRAWEARVRAEFRPVAWAETARAVIAGLAALPPPQTFR